MTANGKSSHYVDTGYTTPPRTFFSVHSPCLYCRTMPSIMWSRVARHCWHSCCRVIFNGFMRCLVTRRVCHGYIEPIWYTSRGSWFSAPLAINSDTGVRSLIRPHKLFGGRLSGFWEHQIVRRFCDSCDRKSASRCLARCYMFVDLRCSVIVSGSPCVLVGSAVRHLV